MSLSSLSQSIFWFDREKKEISADFVFIYSEIYYRVADITLKRILRFWLQIDSVFKYLYNKQIDQIYNGLNIFMEIPLQVSKLNV